MSTVTEKGLNYLHKNQWKNLKTMSFCTFISIKSLKVRAPQDFITFREIIGNFFQFLVLVTYPYEDHYCDEKIKEAAYGELAKSCWESIKTATVLLSIEDGE